MDEAKKRMDEAVLWKKIAKGDPTLSIEVKERPFRYGGV